MDYRNIPDPARLTSTRCPVCGGPLRYVPGPAGTLIGGLVLYLFAFVALGLLLAFPGQFVLWALTDVGLAVLVGFVLSRLAISPGSIRCPRCGWNRTAATSPWRDRPSVWV
jgi:hypothetical protein